VAVLDGLPAASIRLKFVDAGIRLRP
jgi:hypothetical protein